MYYLLLVLRLRYAPIKPHTTSTKTRAFYKTVFFSLVRCFVVVLSAFSCYYIIGLLFSVFSFLLFCSVLLSVCCVCWFGSFVSSRRVVWCGDTHTHTQTPQHSQQQQPHRRPHHNTITSHHMRISCACGMPPASSSTHTDTVRFQSNSIMEFPFHHSNPNRSQSDSVSDRRHHTDTTTHTQHNSRQQQQPARKHNQRAVLLAIVSCVVCVDVECQMLWWTAGR